LRLRRMDAGSDVDEQQLGYGRMLVGTMNGKWQERRLGDGSDYGWKVAAVMNVG
jgi:hypothetical protein